MDSFAFPKFATEKIKFKTGIHYIAGSDSTDGLILKGTPLYIEKYKDDSKYTLFLICRVGTDSINQRNDVRYFNHSQIQSALTGVELLLDIRYAREKIDELNQEIITLKKEYGL
jgi:hypothetical protein